jgi:hypothetical protein
MKLKNLIIYVIPIVLFASFIPKNAMTTFDMNKNELNYVPNAETAIKVAEAIWLPIYGNSIEENKPFVASLNDKNIWIVTGTLKKNAKGGVPYIEIQKSDCRVLQVTHGK